MEEEIELKSICFMLYTHLTVELSVLLYIKCHLEDAGFKTHIPQMATVCI